MGHKVQIWLGFILPQLLRWGLTAGLAVHLELNMSELKKSELKGPDAFQVRLFGVMNWILVNKRQIGLLLLPVAIAAAGGFIWQAISGKLKDGRLKELARIEDKYSTETETAFKKADAASQAAGKVKPDHSGSLAAYTEYAKKNPGSEEGWLAGLRAANITLDKDEPSQADLESALDLVQPVIAKSISSPFHQTAARLLAMAILEDLKRYDEALAQAKILVETVSDDLKSRVLLGKARIEMARAAASAKKEDREEAKNTLNAIIEKHSSSEEAGKARAMLTGLSAIATN